MALTPPQPINESHHISAFDCGVPVLDDWLKLVLEAARTTLARGFASDEPVIRGGNRFVKGFSFRFVVENGDQRGCVDNDHRGKPKSS